MSLLPSNSTAVPGSPLGLLLPKVPSLDKSFGAFLIATFIGLMLYGLTLHQSYRYYRLFPEDQRILRVIVVSTVILETVHIVLCMHVCYYYLVTNYFNPLALLDGVWSIRVLPISTAAVIILSETFFTRRVYLIGSHFRVVVLVAPVLMLVVLGFAIAATVEAFIRPTFADFGKVAWMTSAAFGGAVAVDSLLTGTLILVLQRSRTGFKKTDSLIDVLIIYAINTGLVTGVFSLLSFIFALISPNNLIYSAFNIIACKSYANSLLAVLNSRKSLMDKVQQDCFETGEIGLSALERTTAASSTAKRSAVRAWNVPQLPRAGPGTGGTGVSGTVINISVQRECDAASRGDVESLDSGDKPVELR
ncbi:hypothetical protein C8Q78DRAFT_291526 [Trametes maxima]|nr:hypothetical protein C8Q78DRAFT_291526 [Trametes maxima]